VVKIKYCRTLHQDVTPVPCPIFLPISLAAKEPSISSFPGATEPSTSSFLCTFLSGSAQYVENDVIHSKQTLGKILPRATTPQMFDALPEESTPLNYSFRAASLARIFGCGRSEESTTATHSLRAVSPAQAFMFFRPLESSMPLTHTFRVNPQGIHPERICQEQIAPFLTGSAPQTELAVTHSKETTAPFLTGSKTAIKESRSRNQFAPTLKQPPPLRPQLSQVISTH
jgi:hypothetical protein